VQAVVNADALFIDFAMGFTGHMHDSTILKSTWFFTVFMASLIGTSWGIVADSIYELGRHLWTPFRGDITTMPKPQRQFNKQHSRARIVIERAYGILKMRWRCLFSLAEYKHAPEVLPRIGLACVILHNFLILERTPLSPAESDYIKRVMSEAKLRLRVGKKLAHYNAPYRLTFNPVHGDSGTVGIKRRIQLVAEMGFVAGGNDLPRIPPRPRKKMRGNVASC
jgi:hypothetical protein